MRPTASAQIAPAATPIAIAPIGVTEPQDGVIATRPLTTPDAAPNDVGVAVADPLDREPRQQAGAAGEQGVDEGDGGEVVGAQRRARR